MAFHLCNPSIWWAEAQASLQVQGQPGLHDEFQSSQGYIGRHCQEQKLKGCLRCGSVTGYLPGVCVALGSINPSTKNERQGRDWLLQKFCAKAQRQGLFWSHWGELPGAPSVPVFTFLAHLSYLCTQLSISNHQQFWWQCQGHSGTNYRFLPSLSDSLKGPGL